METRSRSFSFVAFRVLPLDGDVVGDRGTGTTFGLSCEQFADPLADLFGIRNGLNEGEGRGDVACAQVDAGDHNFDVRAGRPRSRERGRLGRTLFDRPLHAFSQWPAAADDPDR